MHRHRVGTAIASAIGMAGTFLPWVSTPIMSLPGTESTMGWVTFGLFTLSLITALAAPLRELMVRSERVVIFLFGALPRPSAS